MTAADLWQSVAGLVLGQYAGATRLKAMIKADVDAFQDTEDFAARMGDAFDLSAASGSWLDLIGSYRNVPRRAGETDADYLVRIRFAFSAHAAGTPDYIIEQAASLSGDPAPQYMNEAPATFFIYTPNGTKLSRAQVQGLAPAGVLGLPGAAIKAADYDAPLFATADGKVILAAARDDETETYQVTLVDDEGDTLTDELGNDLVAEIPY